MSITNEANGPQLRKAHQFLDNKSVKDVVELDKNLLLVLTYKHPEYIVIDLEKNTTHELGEGYSNNGHGLSLTLLPGYDVKNYPYVLCKESDFMCILNPIKNEMSPIYAFQNWKKD